MIAGMAAWAPRLIRETRAGQGMARPLRHWILASWGLGLYAMLPSFLRYAGLPESLCRGWWMNIFFFHPLLDRLVPAGTLPGGFALAGCLALQYFALLWALVRVRRFAHGQAVCAGTQSSA
jgi:hypothetical protein